MRASVAMAALVAGFAAPVNAQVPAASAFPAKPVRMLIPSPPGSSTDTLGRIVKEGLAVQWSQPIVVDNRGGASGRIAAAAVAQAAPDGYTLLFTSGGVLTAARPLFRDLPYDPIRDFAPIAMIAHVPGILVAHPSFPARSVAELIKLAKAKPGSLTHGASSVGSTSHLNMELFKQMAGLDVVSVSYQGDAPAMVALLGGHVQFAFMHIIASLPHIQAGRLRALAVATGERVPQLADLPTVVEAGLPGYETLLFYAMVGPAKMPAALVRQLNRRSIALRTS